MFRRKVRNLDLLRNRVPARNCCSARVNLRVIDPNTPVFLKGIAREPIIRVTRLPLAAVRAIPALLPIHIRAAQKPLLEAILGLLLFLLGGLVVRVEELVHNVLILADAVGEHAAVVAVVVDAPLDVDDLASGVGGDGLGAPGAGGEVIVDVNTGVVAAGAGAADGGGVEIRPGLNGLENLALWAGVRTILDLLAWVMGGCEAKRVRYLISETGSAVGDGEVAVSVNGRGEGQQEQGGSLLHDYGLKDREMRRSE